MRVEMTRSAEGWIALSDAGLAGGVSSRLVAELAELTAVGIVAESMGDEELAGLGLLPAHASFRVFAAPDEAGDEALLCEIGFGNSDPTRGIFAKAVGNDVIYRLDYALNYELPLNYDAYVGTFSAEAEEQASEGLAIDSTAPSLPAEAAAE